jgi:putative ABC transport system permease protein
MAWRQTRGAWRHILGLAACVALGVAALTAVGTLAASLGQALAEEAKALLGGDVELRSSRPLGADAAAALERLAGAGAAVTVTREMAAMARHPARGATLLVELKGVDDGYPLYGRLETAPAGPLSALLAERDGVAGALVEGTLLERLGLRVGEPLEIGAARVVVRGVLVREPDRSASLVTLGPRVLVADRILDRTGLIRLGSRVRHRALVRLPGSTAPRVVAAELDRSIEDPGGRVTTFDEAQPGLRRFFEQLAAYLGLVGLSSLLVGGVGVAAAVTTLVRRQRLAIAVLKCLGADSRLLLATYLTQVGVVGAVASVAGAALGLGAQPVIARVLAPLAPVRLEATWDPWTLLRAVLLGTLVTLLCALWPILEVRAVPASLVLRREVEAAGFRARRPWLATLPIVAALAGLAVWQAGSWTLGGIFIGATVVALAGLALLGRGLARLATVLPPAAGLALRHGLANLRRPGGHTVRVVAALGMGVMLLVAVGLLEGSLHRQLDHERRRDVPSFFFVDIQPDQREAFARAVAAAGVDARPALVPVVRARLSAVDGTPVTRELVARRRAAAPDKIWLLTREYALTWAPEAPAGDRVTRGRWWTPAEAAARPRVSVEEDAARYLGVDLGGILTFDVQGVAVDVEVMSVRKVDWQSLSTNFFMILSPGALDGAPATWVATARVPAGAEARIQDAVVAALPNVTAIPVRAILTQLGRVLDQLAFAVRLIALFAIAAGVAVMAGALAASRYQRLYESVVLKMLGATRATVARAFAVEYACLGLAAGAGGTALAALLAWIVVRFVLEAPWSLDPLALALGVTAPPALSVAIGLGATFRLLGRRPLPVLRGE